MVSDNIAELPVKLVAIPLVMAISVFPAKAAYITFFEDVDIINLILMGKQKAIMFI